MWGANELPPAHTRKPKRLAREATGAVPKHMTKHKNVRFSSEICIKVRERRWRPGRRPRSIPKDVPGGGGSQPSFLRQKRPKNYGTHSEPRVEIAFWGAQGGEGGNPKPPTLTFARETARNNGYHSKPRVKIGFSDLPISCWDCGAPNAEKQNTGERCRRRGIRDLQKTPCDFCIFGGNHILVLWKT